MISRTLVTKFKESTSNINTNLQLLIAGHSFDSKCNCSFEYIPKDIIQVICTSTIMHFIYEYDFDQNGVLSWLRNTSLCSTLINMENLFRWPEGCNFLSSTGVIQHACALIQGDIIGKNVPGTYYSDLSDKLQFYIDLDHFKICLAHITLVSGYHRAFWWVIQEPVFYGSNDQVDWKIITQKKPQLSNISATRDIRTWHFESSKEWYRYIGVQSPHFQVQLSGIEIYGYLA
jgi:hypothetical protein